MVARRVLYVVLGVLMAIGGIACIFSPAETYLSFVWLFGVLMVVDGAVTIGTWSSRRRAKLADGWDLAGGIVSALFGIVLVCSTFVQLVTAVFLVYYLAVWLVVAGVIRVVQAVRLRGMQEKVSEMSTELALLEPRWGWLAAVGVLMVLCGVICLLNPLMAALMMGTLAGLAVAVLGVNLVVTAFVL